MSIIIPSNSIVSGGFSVANSCRFNSGSSDNLQKTPSGDGNKTTFSVSTWVKRSKLTTAHESIWSAGQYQSTAMVQVFFESDDTIHVSQFNAGGGQQARLTTNRLFRDVSAWYHIVAVWDTTQGTDTNRLKLYVNGVQETSFSTAAYPSQNDNTGANTSSIPITIGNRHGNSLFFSGYQCECVLLDGTAAAITDLGEFDEDSGIWKPIDVSGLTFGTNGYYLDFEDSANLGNDANGGTDFTENNLTAIDQSTDTCTNNFATFNSLTPSLQSGGVVAYSEGNTKIVTAYSNTNYLRYPQAYTTLGVTSGKWYAEFKIGAIGSASVGIANTGEFGSDGTTNPYAGYAASGAVYTNGGEYRANNSSTGSQGTYTEDDIIGCALDMDNLAVYWHKNGTYINSGDPTSGSSKTGARAVLTPTTPGGFYVFTAGADNTGIATIEINLGSPSYAISSGNADARGHGNFEYAVPSGYFALCTKNLAEFG